MVVAADSDSAGRKQYISDFQLSFPLCRWKACRSSLQEAIPIFSSCLLPQLYPKSRQAWVPDSLFLFQIFSPEFRAQTHIYPFLKSRRHVIRQYTTIASSTLALMLGKVGGGGDEGEQAI
jgi:hypothetical protein